MKNIIFLVLIFVLTVFSGFTFFNKTEDKNINVYDISVKTIDGTEKSLSDYKGKVLLIVNVASNCGNTPQYEGLENIYGKYKDKGFEILAFPCNDFGKQEPGTNEDIRKFCTTNYHVTFQLFDKIKVLGDDKCALYEKLTSYGSSGDVKWNFEKFLVDKNGNVAGRFNPKVQPESQEVISAIEQEIQK